MERLTRKDHKPRVWNYECYNVKEMAKKLGKLEDIEEKLECPIDVLFKALTKGFFYETELGIVHFTPDDIALRTDVGQPYFFDFGFKTNYGFTDKVFLKDYKTTWWLKKDKSE